LEITLLRGFEGLIFLVVINQGTSLIPFLMLWQKVDLWGLFELAGVVLDHLLPANGHIIYIYLSYKQGKGFSTVEAGNPILTYTYIFL